MIKSNQFPLKFIFITFLFLILIFNLFYIYFLSLLIFYSIFLIIALITPLDIDRKINLNLSIIFTLIIIFCINMKKYLRI